MPTSQHLVIVVPEFPDAGVRVLRQQPDRLLPHLDVLHEAQHMLSALCQHYVCFRQCNNLPHVKE